MKTSTVTCKRCGQTDLVWAISKGGNYYLTDAESTSITNANGRTIKTLQLAHRCLTPEQLEAHSSFDDDCKRAQIILLALQDSFQQISVLVEQPEVDRNAIRALQQAESPLYDELEALTNKHNYRFVLESNK